MYQQRQISEKITDAQLIALLEKVTAKANPTKITVRLVDFEEEVEFG